jgi:chromosome condensin MukBEF MukE localization factor
MMDIQDENSEQSLAERIQASKTFSTRLREILPQFAHILGLLESGVFISSSANVKEFKELSRFQDAYRTLLDMMGHELIVHSAGFFYLRPMEMEVLSKREKQAAASIFCLIENLSDRGMSIESVITKEEPLTLEDLQIMVDQHRERLSSVDLHTVENFVNLGLRKLIETGVMSEIKRQPDRVEYTLGLPAFFYLDICRKMSKDHDEKLKNDPSLDGVEDERSIDEMADDFLVSADADR